MGDEDGATTLSREALELASFRLLLSAKLSDAGVDANSSVSIATDIIRAARDIPGYYPQCMSLLIQHLRTPYGDMLERTIARQLIDGDMVAGEVVQVDLAELATPPDKRRVGTSQIYGKLLLNQMEAEAARGVAAHIERSIYNETINICTFKEITTRSWHNPGFVGIYSGRISTIVMYLDPGSSVCLEYGPRLYQNICAGTVELDALGKMDEAHLCPEAFQQERDEITIRSGQKVEEKTSAMWPCPMCGARKATYREVQDRSSDEPASIYCTCTVCNHNYKPC